ncbi:asparagine synthetase B like [Cryptosporidium ubiquitum]|uniref:Asparagine synthetase B like n=1 Tax=Cryptosporidium ubiquitum TaxID=857276 RepID=A0A1J4MDE8_9CRYT|nr:asparagine synthetase B like [Cryptosporidium ubiquitum]OII70893.1 asparagine synthetase B like [Cryptosporidium ubiquitum]
MIECLFSPETCDGCQRQIFNEEKLGIFDVCLNISKCETNFKKGNTERSNELILLDQETFYIINPKNPDLKTEMLFFGGESSMRIFIDGVIEDDQFQELLKGIALVKITSIKNIVSELVYALSKFNSETGKGFSCLAYIRIKEERFLVFGRDRLGDSSLLISVGSKGKELIISNIESELLNFQEDVQSIEVPVTGMFSLDLSRLEFEFYPWEVTPPYMTPSYWGKEGQQTLESLEEDSRKLLESLRLVFAREMEKRLTFELFEDKAFVYMGMLFSGGLDSTVLLYLLLEWLFSSLENLGVDIIKRFFSNENFAEVQINKNNLFFIVELINTSFAPSEAPDRLTGLASYYEILDLFKSYLWKYKNVSIRLICVDNPGDSLTREEKNILKCISPCRTHLDFNIGGALFFALGGKGILADKESFKEEWWQEIISENENSNIWNGVFEKKSPFSETFIKVPKVNKFEECNNEFNFQRKCPYCSFREHSKCENKCCKSCCRKIQQNLIKPIGESSPACRVHKMKTADFSKIPSTQRFIDPKNYYLCETNINKILFPQEQEYVKGLITTEDGKLLYNSKSKFLIVGSGADEFLGGYGRHITAKKHNGSEGIKKEMLFDINRLWIRNLGRDYRLALFNNRKLFAVFLHPLVINSIGELSFENICGSKFEVTKPLLRFIANKLGIQFSSKFKKRAVQFGTRSSRQTNLKHFDSNRKATADATYIPVNI